MTYKEKISFLESCKNPQFNAKTQEGLEEEAGGGIEERIHFLNNFLSLIQEDLHRLEQLEK